MMLLRSSSLRSLLLLLVAAPVCFAQKQPSTEGSYELYTLHVHEDLIQVPVLVLDRTRKSKADLTSSDFSLQLDSGPVFHPRKIHVEGDDPLSVIFLLDAGDERQRTFFESFQEHLGDLPPNLFHSQDRLSVFAFDCSMIAALQNQPGSEALFQRGVTRALGNPALHGQPGGCPHPISLWDAVSAVASLSDSLPGRRVMFVVSPGQDGQSIHSAQVTRRYTASLGITVMGIRDVDGSIGKPEDLFALLCGDTGGIDAYVTAYSMGRSLMSLFDMIRNRYIVEFPLPSNGTRGVHHLDVTLADRTLVVRAGGNSAPLLDSTMINDPSLTPDAAPRPVLGTRKPIYPK